MKKTIQIALLSIVCILSSCNKNDELLNPTAIDGNSALSIGDNVSVMPAGETVHLAFTADSKWTLTGLTNVAWLKSSVTFGGKGTTLIALTASINDTGMRRSATLKITGDNVYKEFKVTQDVPVFKVSTESIFFDWDKNAERNASPINLAIESNIRWLLSVDTDASAHDLAYYSLIDTITLGSHTLSILPQSYNFGKTEEISYLILQPVAYDENMSLKIVNNAIIPPYRIQLRQKNLRFLINDSLEIDPVIIGPLNDSKSTYVTIDAEHRWEVKSPNWVRISTPDGIDTIAPARIFIKADTVRQARTDTIGKVSVTLQDYGVSKEFWVCQRGYQLQVDTSSIAIEHGDTRPHTLLLNSSGQWEIRNSPSWLTVSPMNGTGNATISVSVVKDTELVELVDSFQICSTLNPLFETINVSYLKRR